ncbi:hypothetical protein D8Y20_01175 [Mariprofundus sp. EBB-1]|uniref:hypothetical protein n=1 Tax=Mariprofundus sp. EBB-1 TaxID=2650971 RepID=UPI000EF192A7|nr:hypothetical protein [Mariprofundus sp. EBB-1]RLL55546.1 hypothetical protein D8Y20_01175 [Mariprofundus sp. EBB-1]
MNIDFSLAPWGMGFAAMMFLIGNGAWTNHIVRHKPWMGWVIWGLTVPGVIIIAAVIELRLSGQQGIWHLLTSVNIENHWIVATLYALISIPGAASVLFRQNISWTRLATLSTALIVMVPLGNQINDPNDSRIALSLGITLALCGMMFLWSTMLDCNPIHRRKTVPVEESDQ